MSECNSRATPRYMSIGKLSRKTGVSTDALRYYEREGLLPRPRRRVSGHRAYDEEAIEQVRFILRAKELGFNLDEIANLLNFSSDAKHGVANVKARASRRLAEIEEQIARLESVRARLASLVAVCPGHGPPERCPILSALRSEESVSPCSCKRAPE
ncbi:MAG: heavy metal-responsive transcriptional regulator [Helicobacteraceae bacterium]|jgi:MerR family copper efflux transcriptional regulator|nr:heavy metal-responsive transcriptional regulator [Helicobacteraceae bacterium]